MSRAERHRWQGEGWREWLVQLDEEHDNIRAVLAWTVERREPERPLKIATSIWFYWMIRGQLSEGAICVAGVAGVPSCSTT